MFKLWNTLTFAYLPRPILKFSQNLPIYSKHVEYFAIPQTALAMHFKLELHGESIKNREADISR